MHSFVMSRQLFSNEMQVPCEWERRRERTNLDDLSRWHFSVCVCAIPRIECGIVVWKGRKMCAHFNSSQLYNSGFMSCSCHIFFIIYIWYCGDNTIMSDMIYSWYPGLTLTDFQLNDSNKQTHFQMRHIATVKLTLSTDECAKKVKKNQWQISLLRAKWMRSSVMLTLFIVLTSFLSCRCESIVVDTTIFDHHKNQNACDAYAWYEMTIISAWFLPQIVIFSLWLEQRRFEVEANETIDAGPRDGWSLH